VSARAARRPHVGLRVEVGGDDLRDQVGQVDLALVHDRLEPGALLGVSSSRAGC
jgi:hypothetical protein